RHRRPSDRDVPAWPLHGACPCHLPAPLCHRLRKSRKKTHRPMPRLSHAPKGDHSKTAGGSCRCPLSPWSCRCAASVHPGSPCPQAASQLPKQQLSHLPQEQASMAAPLPVSRDDRAFSPRHSRKRIHCRPERRRLTDSRQRARQSGCGAGHADLARRAWRVWSCRRHYREQPWRRRLYRARNLRLRGRSAAHHWEEESLFGLCVSWFESASSGFISSGCSCSATSGSISAASADEETVASRKSDSLSVSPASAGAFVSL